MDVTIASQVEDNRDDYYYLLMCSSAWLTELGQYTRAKQMCGLDLYQLPLGEKRKPGNCPCYKPISSYNSNLLSTILSTLSCQVWYTVIHIIRN